MAEGESDNQSVESGSCTCSDYNEDISWFYDSRKLGTSFMRFCILSDENNIIIKKEKSRNFLDDKRLSRINKYNEIKKDLFSNSGSKRKNVIKLKNSSSCKKDNNKISEDNSDKEKLNDNNLMKYSHRRRKNNNSLDFLNNNSNNKSSRKQSNISNDYCNNTYTDININSKRRNFFPENLNEYEHNYSAPIESYFNKNYLNHHRSPINYFNKRRNIFNMYNKNEGKVKQFEIDVSKEYVSPRRRAYNSLTNTNYFNDDINGENQNESNVINKNFQTNGKTIKEKIVKETKTITLQPGETIKPKMTSKRKLKPNTTIVKNQDGSQNIIIENTILTTITENELIDSSKLYNDKYPVDIQLVKQNITKIYKTEIENNPYP